MKLEKPNDKFGRDLTKLSASENSALSPGRYGRSIPPLISRRSPAKTSAQARVGYQENSNRRGSYSRPS